MKCYKCQENKTEDQFPVNRTKPTGRSDLCKACKNAYNKEHYTRRKGYYVTKAQKRKNEILEYLKKLKDVPCADCKQKFAWYVMDFDHLRDKQFEISSAARSKSMEAIKSELAKCDVVCSNCHRERTYQRRNIPIL